MVKNSLLSDVPRPLPLRYARYRRLVLPAAESSSLWRLLLGGLVAIFVAGLWAAAVLLAARQGQLIGLAVGPSGQNAFATAALLLAVAGIGVGTLAALHLVHRRSLARLIGPGAVALRHFALAAGVTWAVAIALALVSLPFAPDIDLARPVTLWAAWLPIAILFLILQTGGEEIFFRGYLQSQLAARFRHPLVWMVLPSMLFGALHFAPFLSTTAALIYVAAAALYGILAADLTARTGTLGAAWGFHFANNFVVIAIVAVDPNMSGLALFHSGGDLETSLRPGPLLIVDILMLLLVWRLIRRTLGA